MTGTVEATASSVVSTTGVDRSAPRRDAVAEADALRDLVARRIEELLASCAEEGDDGAAVLDIYVGWVAALDAAGCPARYRAGGEDGWGFPGWSPALAAGAVGRAALARHLGIAPAVPSAAGAPGATPLPAPLAVVRDWLREAARAPAAPVAEWIAGLVRSGDRTTVAATAAAATRWVAGLLRVVGWPFPDRLGIVADDTDGPGGASGHVRRWPKRWRPSRGSPVCVAGSPDAILGKVTAAGEFDLVVHRPTSPADDAVAARAAFEAAAGALGTGIVPQSVLVTTGDTGERLRVPVDGRLLERGADLITTVVQQRLVAAQPGWDMTDGTPGPACRHCPHNEACPPGQTWLATPVGRRRGGLPVLPVEAV